MDFTGQARRIVLLAYLTGAACSASSQAPHDDNGGSSGRGEGGGGRAPGGGGGSAKPDAAADRGDAGGGTIGSGGALGSGGAIGSGGTPGSGGGLADSGPPDVAAPADMDLSPDAPAGAFALASPAFNEGDDIATTYRCPPAPNLSPPLAWTPGPAGTQSYAVTLARAATLHWVVWDIPGTVTTLPADLPKVDAPPVPAGARQLAGGYFGPCPQGGRVSYDFVLYALKVARLPGVSPQSTTKALAAALEAQALARTTLTVFGAK
jgi:Raf kinase inhibitor-like YbhB/YbcL family protein